MYTQDLVDDEVKSSSRDGPCGEDVGSGLGRAVTYEELAGLAEERLGRRPREVSVVPGVTS